MLIEKPTPEALLMAIESTRAAICFTAPTMYRQMALLLTDSTRCFDVRSLRKTVSAGEVLPDATRQLWKQATDIEMIDGIGATEMIHIFIAAAGADVRAGAIGKAVPGYRAIVVDDSMNEVPRGTAGKLAVKGPSGCRYLADDRQTQLRAQWLECDRRHFCTGRRRLLPVPGALGRHDRDVWIQRRWARGRSALLMHPAVAECGVVGVTDDERGQRVAAYVVLKEGFSRSADLCVELQTFVSRRSRLTNIHAR